MGTRTTGELLQPVRRMARRRRIEPRLSMMDSKIRHLLVQSWWTARASLQGRIPFPSLWLNLIQLEQKSVPPSHPQAWGQRRRKGVMYMRYADQDLLSGLRYSCHCLLTSPSTHPKGHSDHNLLQRILGLVMCTAWALCSCHDIMGPLPKRSSKHVCESGTSGVCAPLCKKQALIQGMTVEKPECLRPICKKYLRGYYSKHR